MSMDRDAAGSWTTSAGSVAGRSAVIGVPSEQVAAEQVARVRGLHVRAGVDDDVPATCVRRVLHADRRPDVGVALAVGDDLVQGEHGLADRNAAEHRVAGITAAGYCGGPGVRPGPRWFLSKRVGGRP